MPSEKLTAEPPMHFRIPPRLLEHFKNDVRIVIGHGSIGIPVPDNLLTDELRAAAGKEFQVILTPVGR